MVADNFNLILNEIGMLHKQFGGVVDTGFLVLCRMLGFMLIAPVFGRKDIPFTIKLSIALMLTSILVWHIPAGPTQKGLISTENIMPYVFQIFMNTTIGAIIGFVGTVIMEAINAAGSLMNNQVGLSSAMMFDPSSRQQVALFERVFGYIALMVFFHVGGMYWLLSALSRSFEIFPVYAIKQDIVGNISLEYLIQISGNTLSVATQFMAPVMVVTMAVDLMLGIVNRTAQQIQVFQLSHALKPSIGIAAFLMTLPIFIKILENYLHDYSSIF